MSATSQLIAGRKRWGFAMNSKILMAAAAAALAVSLSAGNAKANTFVLPPQVFFVITSDTNPTITFEVPLSPTPNFVNPGNSFVLITQITVGGSPGGDDEFTFYNASSGGGLSETDEYFGPFGIYTSAQLYTGTEQSPTFVPGIYPGTYTVVEEPGATITISGTPLPSTWTMLIAGFVGLGFFAYRGTKNRAAATAAA